MRHYRRWVRNAVGQLVGVQGDLQIWWAPEIPIVYLSNPKSGCSTIKHSLKAAQADVYHRSGRDFERTDDPHIGDDCLTQRLAGLRAPAESATSSPAYAIPSRARCRAFSTR